MSETQSATRNSGATRALVAALRCYQGWLSPVFGAMGARCRFEPSCSQYAVDAVQAHGPLRGIGMAIWRVLRCNPFNRGGYDPAVVPSKNEPEQRGVRCFT